MLCIFTRILNHMKRKTYTVTEAKQALEHYCAYRERTHGEVAQKLRDMGMIPVVSEQIIAGLIQDDFLNETRFAKSFARGKFRINHWGKIKIKQQLQQKGVSEANIKTGLSEIDPDEYQNTLRQLIAKKYPKIKAKNSFEKKQKLVQYLRLKGFEMSLIQEMLVSS